MFKRINIRLPRFVQRHKTTQPESALPLWMRPEMQPIVVQSSGRAQGGNARRSTHSRRRRGRR